MTAAAQITNPAQESCRAGVYVRGTVLMFHYRTVLTDESTQTLRWVVSNYGYLLTALRKNMLQEWTSFSDFAALIKSAYFSGEPKTQAAIEFLKRLDLSESCFSPLTLAERVRMFNVVYASAHRDFKCNDLLMSWAGYGGGLVSVDTISEMELVARYREAMRKR